MEFIWDVVKSAELPWNWTPKCLQFYNIRQPIITKMTTKELKRKNSDRSSKNRWKRIPQNFCKTFAKKKSKEQQIQFSQNKETSNQAFIVQGPGNFHQFPELTELCISVDRGKNFEWRKISVKKRSRKWDCYIFYNRRFEKTGIMRKHFGRRHFQVMSSTLWAASCFIWEQWPHSATRVWSA